MDLERVIQEEESIENIIDVDEYFCQVEAGKKENLLDRKSNCTILAFITARNRIALHQHMMSLEKDGCTIFYCDTDSILFTRRRNQECIPIPIGAAIGDFKYEISRESEILGFDAYGRKNFELIVKSIDQTGKSQTKTLTKVCGMTISPQLVQDKLKNNRKKETIEVPQLRNRFSKAEGFHKPTVSKFTLSRERRCERIIKHESECLETVPWGF